MKKLFGILFTILVIYVIYLDLTVGTLAPPTSQRVDSKPVSIVKHQTSMPSFEAKVKPGETVISIVEHRLEKPLPVAITDLIEDFKKLNPGHNPEKIQIGATYQFPDYSK